MTRGPAWLRVRLPGGLEQELELKTNTQLTREIHVLTTELHRRLVEQAGA